MPKPHIALLLEDGATASSVATTLDMLRLAQRFQGADTYQASLFSSTGGLVHLGEGLQVSTQALPTHLTDFDAVVVPGFFAESLPALKQQLHTTWHGAVQRLRTLAPHALVAASCHGTFTLAQSGLLDGQSATTSWWFAQAFAQHYPQVRLDADKAVVESGRSITAGAMTAHADLCLQLLRRLGGTALARKVGGIMLIDGARTSQRPFMALQQNFDDPLVEKAVAWMCAHLDQSSCSVSALAQVLHTSYRTLHRRFMHCAGMAPLAYWQALRVERAKELLEESAQPSLEEVMVQVGYEDAASFRRLFQRLAGMSVAQYRRSFGPTPRSGR